MIWHTAVSPLLRLFYATVIPSSCEFFALSFKIFRTGHFLQVLSGIRCIRQSSMVWNKLCSSYRKWYAELYAISGMVVKVIKDIWRKRNRHPSNPSTEFTSFSFFLCHCFFLSPNLINTKMKWEIRHRTLSQHANTLRKLWNQIRVSELNCLKIMFSLGTSSFLPVLFHPFPLTFWAAVPVHYIMITIHLIYKFLRARNLNLHNQPQNCLFYTETLEKLDLFSLSKRLKGDLTTMYRCPHKEKKI